MLKIVNIPSIIFSTLIIAWFLYGINSKYVTATSTQYNVLIKKAVRDYVSQRVKPIKIEIPKQEQDYVWTIPSFSRKYNKRYTTYKKTKIIVWSWFGEDTVRVDQLRQTVRAVHERLSIVPKNDPNLIALLMETCAAESLRGILVKQVRGPARGLFQMEPFTEKDTLKWLKRYFVTVYKEVMHFYNDKENMEWNRRHNVPFQIAMSTVYYWRMCGDKLVDIIPNTTARAHVWKRFYNTPKGKGTVAGYVQKVKKYL